MNFQYCPELGAAIARVRSEAEALFREDRRVFVELKRWRAYLDGLEERAKALAEESERQRRHSDALAHACRQELDTLRESASAVLDINENCPETRSLVDRIIKSSDHLAVLLGAT